jgi:hypothetical protein
MRIAIALLLSAVLMLGQMVEGISPAPGLQRNADGSYSIVTTLPASGVVTEAGTSLTLTAATHNGRILRFASGTDVTLTVPSGLGAGFSCLIVQRGAGVVIPTAGGGVTIRQRLGYTKTAGLYAIATLACDVANDCILSGDLQ